MEATRNRWEWRAVRPARWRRWWRWMVAMVVARVGTLPFQGVASPSGKPHPSGKRPLPDAEAARERFRDEARAAVRETMRW